MDRCGASHKPQHLDAQGRRIKDSGSAWNTVTFRPVWTTHCKPLLEMGRERRNTLTSMLGYDFTKTQVSRFYYL